MKIYLDDWRPCPEGYVVARNFKEFQRLMINNDDISHISLDYDLDDYKWNGLGVCKWMVECEFVPKNINIHSTHSGGKQMLEYLMENVSKDVVLTYQGQIMQR